MLDTNACLDFLLARNVHVARRIERAFGDLGVSAITAAELQVGNRTSADPEGDARQVDTFLSGVEIAAFDEAAASAYGRMVQRTGIRRASFDRLIAAHCIATGWTLVTNNARDFADISGLRVENWTQ